MGNICGKSEDNFSQPGRVLGAAPPPQPRTAPIPKKVGGPGRALGGGSAGPNTASPAADDPSSTGGSDARLNAAAAAAKRQEEANRKAGKLGKDSLARRGQSDNQVMRSETDMNRRARDLEETRQAQAWN